MNKKCELIRDLLPLYVENMCSGESRRIVAEHLSDCGECRRELEKMNQGIAIQADSDISVLKRIKRRSMIENIVIVAVCIIATVFVSRYVNFFFLNTECTMDYNKYNIAENAWVEEDEDGDLIFCTKGWANEAMAQLVTVSDRNDNHSGYCANDEDFNEDQRIGWGITLKQRRIDSYSQIHYGNKNVLRSVMFNKDEKPDIQYIFYYDDVTDTEYVLWERN